MPRLDGLELTRRLRADGNQLPILMLTARDQVADRVAGLEAGADDYLVKPFALEELVARVRALLRRLGTDDEPTTLSFADLELNTGTREVTRGDESARAHPHRVRAARALPAQPAAGADALGDLRPRLGLRLRLRLELARRLHQLPAQEDRGRRQAAADPHRPRRGVRAARAVSHVASGRGSRSGRPPPSRSRSCSPRSSSTSSSRSELRAQVDRNLQSEAAQIANVPRFAAFSAYPHIYALDVPRRSSSGYFQLVDSAGNVYLPTGLRRAEAAARGDATGCAPSRTGTSGAFFYDTRLEGDDTASTPMHVVRHPAGRDPGRRAALAASTTSSRGSGSGCSSSRWSASALAGVAGFLVARATLRPLRELSETAERVRATRDLSQRIDVDVERRDRHARRHLQRDARLARRGAAAPAAARAGRLARAADAAHEPAHEHRGARRRRAACRPTSARSSCATWSPSSER